MFSCPPGSYNAIPPECRSVAEALFPPEGFLKSAGSRLDAAHEFAEVLGIGPDYQKLLASENPPDIHKFFGHFRNNIDLLIQKTWVEKADETRKDKLRNQIPIFISNMEQEDYYKATLEFGVALEELAYLFFGAQSAKDDFIEYALRIDTQMGLFWWYGGQIRHFPSLDEKSRRGNQAKPEDQSPEANIFFKAIVLIGMCYLTNF